VTFSARCEVCGDRLPWQGTGRPPKYCNRCRAGIQRAKNVAAYRKRKRRERQETKPGFGAMRHDEAIDTIIEILAQ
jgi:hypothetical protein